jgi:hypothetical protein
LEDLKKRPAKFEFSRTKIITIKIKKWTPAR